MIIKRRIKEKVQQYEYKGKAMNFDISRTFKFNSEDYKKFQDKCKKLNVKSCNDMIRTLMDQFVGEDK